MKFCNLRYIAFLLLALFSLFSVKGREKVGLVLSGGGAKGIAHIGVIKALEDNDIPIDYVAGTSAGAIVGSLYSCGWTPQQILDLFLSQSFKYWSSGTVNKNLEYYISIPTLTPAWITINPNHKDSSNLFSHIIPSSLISPIPMNLEFLELYAPYTQQCGQNFNDLFVPFRCVTSDVYHKHKIVCKDGSLGDAVRASMSFPMVFKPIEMDGVLVFDGGIYDNFPVDVMKKDFDPDFIIGVSVSGPDGKPIKNNIYSQLEDMIIQNNDYDLPADEGVKIQVPVLNFGVLDWSKGEEIYSIGYKTGLSMVDSIKKRLPAREPLDKVNERRREFAKATPDVKFEKVEVNGASEPQTKYIQFLFQGQNPDHPIDLAEVKEGYYKAVAGDKFYDLLPQARFSKTGTDTLLLDASIKSPWSIGVGGWISTSTNSMLYIGAGYHTLRFNSIDVDLGGWLGQSYYAAELRAKFGISTKSPSYILLEAVINRQKYYDSEILFYESDTPPFITEAQQFGRFSYKWAMGKPALGYVSLSYGRISNQFFPQGEPGYMIMNKDRCIYNVGAFKTGIEINTLNDLLYPSSGRELDFNILVNYEKNKFIPYDIKKSEITKKAQVNASMEIIWKNYFNLHNNFKAGVHASGLLSLQHLNQNYTCEMIHLPAFAPTPSTRNYFNTAFRSNNYIAIGVMPIWSPIDRAQIRGDFYFFSPVRNITENSEGMAVYDGWFKKQQFIGEIAAVYNFPFASLSLYVNYLSSPRHNWNFGINFGLFFQAPRLLR